VSYSAALTTATFNRLADHLLRSDLQEDVCFALWYPSSGGARTTALISEPILPNPGERHVHGNASFEAHYLDRAIDCALVKGAGIALLHSHPGPGWQGMSADDVAAEKGKAAQVYAATGLPLVGLTIGTDGALSARFWIRAGARQYRREWCETVRVTGEHFQITFDERQRPAPTAAHSQLRTVSAWGAEAHARVARLRIGVIGAGSVGSIVAEALARTGITNIRLIDFDTVEEHNLDRLLHANRKHIGEAKAAVVGEALERNSTSNTPDIEPLELSVCERGGFAAALDCDILFSCVDRPWPRKVLNVIAYAHLIPVIDGGIRVSAPAGRLKRADWKALTATPGRICLECSGQFDPADVVLERDGLLDDPRYIQSLPADHRLRIRENVFAFSTHLASLEVLQLLAMVVAPHGISNHGVQTYHFVTSDLDRDILTCKPTCRYCSVHLARGDNVESGLVEGHAAAEAARAFRRERRSDDAVPRATWRTRLRQALTVS
jgi:molybdopterin-synthase adenylyltransferase